MTTERRDVADLLATALADPAVTWSLGGFGALATFSRGSCDPVAWLDDGRLGLVTARGGIALVPDRIVPVAYETAFGTAWSHTVALCLPEASCPASPRSRVTECGPDREALRPQDRGAILFDGGLGLRQAAIGLRSDIPAAVAALRLACGEPLALSNLRQSPAPTHRVATSPGGRIEIFCAGDGPRLFADETVLRAARTHAATAPIPPGLVPFAHLHPPASLDRSGPDPGVHRDRHEAFQALLRRWGVPELVDLKDALARGAPMPAAAGRHARMVAKVVAAQSAARLP
ncbi:hypothetical protein [Methylobacterium sp. Leaf108]|uniref:DUF6925 family protein n=1 Tax=Methylobacterium sp. Leaf108 TaxID=1736256 RepID=UPI0006FC8E00|nr:hypothetical protein [Methylobacterium sp. Leaf108]KQP52723.1 hypothetical protein ASF39_07465 [Methylobacterium sp. Leaf108]